MSYNEVKERSKEALAALREIAQAAAVLKQTNQQVDLNVRARGDVQ